MKKLKRVILINYLICIIINAVSQQNNESIHDRLVHIESKLISEIPVIEPFCDLLPIKKQRINVGDCFLYVEESGEGIPIVLINGGPGGTHHCFHPWFEEVSKFARVIYYDQRGCGLSDYFPGENGYSVEQATDDLDSLRKALHIDKWVVLGFSFGGFLAQYYTLRYPENVSGLVLLGATPGIKKSTGFSRQNMFLKAEEKERMQEINLELNQLIKDDSITRDEYVKLNIYNNFLNGDWKRQYYYKPNQEMTIRIALYEWKHDFNFNNIMFQSYSRIKLDGAFKNNPIPTLILEGEWDLTWSDEKKHILQANHPNSQMVVFENAAHSIFNEEPKKFFSVLKEFILNIRTVDDEKLQKFKKETIGWKNFNTSQVTKIISLGWGIMSSKKIVEDYKKEDLYLLEEFIEFLRVGFALYDMENYYEALYVFQTIEEKFGSEKYIFGVSLIWQGHMLDLIGKRDEAIERYKIVSKTSSNFEMKHGQYSISYKISAYAIERMKIPFIRIENNMVD